MSRANNSIILQMQLYVPLNMLGTVYRSINTSLVDTERLLKLLDEPTDVNDKQGAPDLIVEDGELEFGGSSLIGVLGASLSDSQGS